MNTNGLGYCTSCGNYGSNCRCLSSGWIGIGQTGQSVPYSGITFTVPVTTCTANQHVFACDHAVKCKCGKTARSEADLPVTKCGGCGKTL